MPFPPIIEEISPATIGEDTIVLSLDPTTLTPRALNAVLINVDYSACAPNGVVLPLELLIQAPSASNCRRHVYRRKVPSALSFIPKEGGLHGVVLREIGHHRWLGKLRVFVAGDSLNPQIPS
jgi:hypothetical protein